jgi:hypothetical protein
MGKFGKLRRKFTAFVNQLSPDQVREQLVLAYLQMEQCQRVLRGEDVEPVEMIDNGESSDLELFYRCKKAAEELAYLNDELLHLKAEDFLEENSKPGDKAFVVKVDLKKFYPSLRFDTSDSFREFKELREQFKKMAESMKARVLQVGTEVYFLSKGRIHKSVVEDFVGLVSGDGTPVCRVKGHDNAIPANYLYDSAVRLASHAGKTVSNHVSLSSDHESAFFIDSTNRVFKGAKWYLEDQKIENFASINDLRGFLISNVIDDTKK